MSFFKCGKLDVVECLERLANCENYPPCANVSADNIMPNLTETSMHLLESGEYEEKLFLKLVHIIFHSDPQ